MNNILQLPGPSMDSAGEYLIRVRGNINVAWLDYYQDLTIVVSTLVGLGPISTLCTHGADQAALLGILNRLYTFGYPLLYVEYIGLDAA